MTTQPATRAEWIRRVLDEHELPLLHYALRLTGDADTARDVVQETLLRLCRTESAAIDGHVGPWLFRVCRQRALDAKRKEHRMPTVTPETDSCGSAGDDPARLAEQRDAGHAALRLLAELPANQQEVVRLKFQSGLSYRDIAEVTGLTVTNVGYLMHTALARLRERLTVDDVRHTTTPHDRSPTSFRSSP